VDHARHDALHRGERYGAEAADDEEGVDLPPLRGEGVGEERERPGREAEERRAALAQGGLSSLISVAAIVGPVLAAQALAFGAPRGLPGAAFLVAGALIGAAALIILAFTPATRAQVGD
ncbi:MAG TPA: hypothetical protein VF636_06510, partial [Sphingomonas sp.]